MLKKGTKIRVNDDTFKGLREFNGATAKIDGDKDGNPVIGSSGKTVRMLLHSGGCIWLEPGQYTTIIN